MPDFVAPKGVPDYYPPVSRTFDAVKRTLLTAADRAGYGPIELPVFEDTGLFARGVGEFGATIMFAGSLRGVTQTLSLAIYELFDVDFECRIARAVAQTDERQPTVDRLVGPSQAIQARVGEEVHPHRQPIPEPGRLGEKADVLTQLVR